MTLSIDHDTKIIRISPEYLRGLLKTVGEIIDVDTSALDDTYAIFMIGGGTEPNTEANIGPAANPAGGDSIRGSIRKGEPTVGHRVVPRGRIVDYYTNAPLGSKWNWYGCGIRDWEHSAYRREPRYACEGQTFYRDVDGIERPGPDLVTTAEVKAWIDAAPERHPPLDRYYVETDVIVTYTNHAPFGFGITQLGSDPRRGAAANRCRQADYIHEEWHLYDAEGHRVGATRDFETARRFVRDGVVPSRSRPNTPEPW